MNVRSCKDYTHGAAAYGFVRNLEIARRLPVSKLRQYLHSKASYTKFGNTTIQENEIFC